MIKTAPLKSSVMLTSIIGLVISITFTLSGRFSEWFGQKIDPVTNILIYDRGISLGFAFTLVFIFLFIATMISMTHSSITAEESLDHFYKKRKD